MALVSADSERTMATYLGAAAELLPGDLTRDIFEDYSYLYIEGYLVQNRELIETAIKQAKSKRCKIALDLSSYNVVSANLDFLKYLLEEYVDIIFANEEEAYAFTGKEPREALEELAGFEKTGNFPQLTILRLPNDHTAGTAPGKPTPTVYRSMLNVAG